MGEVGTEEAAALIGQSNDFRLLRRVGLKGGFARIEGELVGRVAFLDFETTGDGLHDRAVEIGMVQMEYGQESGRLGQVLARYEGFEDPGMPIPEHISALTGITDSMVSGHRFDDQAVNRLVESSSLLVAHNAAFDRRFGERRFGSMANKPWACSMADVPWREAGIGSRMLEFIAFKKGWFYEAHRATADCEVCATVLNEQVLDGKTGMEWLLMKARRPHYRLWALDAPYEMRGALSARGYRWEEVPMGKGKAWVIECTVANEEVDWLNQEVMRKGGLVRLEEMSPVNRFTGRTDRVENLELGALA